MRYSIHVELEFTIEDRESPHEFLREILEPLISKQLHHYHLLGAPRKLYELDEELDEEARRTEEDAQP